MRSHPSGVPKVANAHPYTITPRTWPPTSNGTGDANTHVSTFFDLEDVVSFTYAEKNQRIEY